MAAVNDILLKCESSPEEAKDLEKRPDSAMVTPLHTQLSETTHSVAALFAPSVFAKIWGVALRQLNKPSPPNSMPEYTLPGETKYECTDASFWTSGFFPGSLYLLYERRIRWPRSFQDHHLPHPLRLQFAARWWSQKLHAQAYLVDTHDLGFLIHPWARLGWELDQDADSYKSLAVAARGLAARFDARVGCIRSWDTCYTKRYAFADPKDDFLVIIDNMMNLDLLYYVSDLTKSPHLAEIATTHALTTLESHIRADNSTCHVVNFEQADGSVKQRMTNQGYADESCWSRGQAWGITGFAQCYHWTGDSRFLDASQRLVDYFLDRLPADNVPYWDFDAPKPGPRDTSAAMVAAYGMLLLFEKLPSQPKYLDAALRIVSGVIDTSLSPDAKIFTTSTDDEVVDLGGHDTILLHATINNYKFAPRIWADHGLVYADYYFLLFGNKLLELNLV